MASDHAFLRFRQTTAPRAYCCMSHRYHRGTASAVDYDAVIPFKRRALEAASANFRAGVRPDLRGSFEAFCAEHGHWLEDYALFRALQRRYEGRHYLEWPGELVERVPAALAQA